MWGFSLPKFTVYFYLFCRLPVIIKFWMLELLLLKTFWFRTLVKFLLMPRIPQEFLSLFYLFVIMLPILLCGLTISANSFPSIVANYFHSIVVVAWFASSSRCCFPFFCSRRHVIVHVSFNRFYSLVPYLSSHPTDLINFIRSLLICELLLLWYFFLNSTGCCSWGSYSNCWSLSSFVLYFSFINNYFS